MLAQALLDRTEARRVEAARLLDPKERSRRGQFFTPAPVANFLASLVVLPARGMWTLLDPGAGIGTLAASVVARAVRERPGLACHVVCFENDPTLVSQLDATLADCATVAESAGVALTYDVRPEDFISWACRDPLTRFDACVMNPPYRKINADEVERSLLESAGLRVTNLYAAFLALATERLTHDGQLVAITPRSFANGTYFKPFRRFMLERIALERVHVYERRGQVFAEADVLQENVVFSGRRRNEPPTELTISTSSGRAGDPITAHRVAYADVVYANDPDAFIRIPTSESDHEVARQMARLPATLSDLGIEVSTGRVVDFRTRENLRAMPEVGTAPLIYPSHVREQGVQWPQPTGRKPNALAINDQTAPLLLPNEIFVLVKRFTAKEERRRVVAALSSPDQIRGEVVAFENHLNVFHAQARGLHGELASGLVVYLNSSLVDAYVRQFSGHTQINASDLRQLSYPSRAMLIEIGARIAGAWPQSQEALDALLYDVLGVADDSLRDVA